MKSELGAGDKQQSLRVLVNRVCIESLEVLWELAQERKKVEQSWQRKQKTRKLRGL